MTDDWREHLIDDHDGIARIVREARRIGVLGIKPESRRGQPAFDVPEYMAANGYEIAPVPVYYPEITTILGKPVVRRVADVAPPADLINVFRRSQDIPPHLDDILAARPRAVWFQLGIRNDAAAERLARAGIDVVQDRCILVEHRRLAKPAWPRAR
jgi:predicted CoA-binding protein